MCCEEPVHRQCPPCKPGCRITGRAAVQLCEQTSWARISTVSPCTQPMRQALKPQPSSQHLYFVVEAAASALHQQKRTSTQIEGAKAQPSSRCWKSGRVKAAVRGEQCDLAMAVRIPAPTAPSQHTEASVSRSAFLLQRQDLGSRSLVRSTPSVVHTQLCSRCSCTAAGVLEGLGRPCTQI